MKNNELYDFDYKENVVEIDFVTNILLNMSGGLLPEHLTEDEVEALRGKFGKDWFDALGYTEDLYKKPTFMNS